MAFTVEDGSVVPGANAFIDLAFANDYHTDRGNSGWTGADAVKQAAIIKATEFMEANYTWATGYKVDPDQSLGWPRYEAYDWDDNILAEDEVPAQVQRACAELALRALTASLLADQGRRTSMEKVGDLEVRYEKDAQAETRYPLVEGILRGLIPSGSASVEVSRG